MRIFFSLFFIFIVIFVKPLIVNSAEILQINDSNTVLIGDQNRNLKIHLACSIVEEENEFIAVDLLKKFFPRGTKVKIKPSKSIDNDLLAKIYNIKEDVEMTQLLKSNHLSKDPCND